VQACVKLKEYGGNLVDCNSDHFDKAGLESSRARSTTTVFMDKLLS
jgi:hypothetical protein